MHRLKRGDGNLDAGERKVKYWDETCGLDKCAVMNQADPVQQLLITFHGLPQVRSESMFRISRLLKSRCTRGMPIFISITHLVK